MGVTVINSALRYDFWVYQYELIIGENSERMTIKELKSYMFYATCDELQSSVKYKQIWQIQSI